MLDPFHFLDFFQPSTVTLASIELCPQEDAHEVGGELGADHFGAETKDVHVVVLDTLVRRVDIVTHGCPDAGELVRGHRGPDAGATDEHAAHGLAAPNGLTDLARRVRVIDRGIGIVHAEIDHLVPERADRLGDAVFELDAAMVESDGNFHRAGTLSLMTEHERWRELGQQLRVDSIRCAATTNSGHPTSSMSAADLIAVLVGKYLRYDFADPKNPNNDHLIFSKGHASPLLYAVYKAAGAIADEELLSFRKFGSRLEGHPTPVLPWVDVATGSLGQGLPIGVGIALAGKKLDRLPYRTWVLCGDSEMAEGSMWEAFEHAAFYGLDNLTAVIDVNRLGQRGETMHGWDLDSYVERAEAFGWRAIAIDGHDVAEIDRAYAEAVGTSGRPTAIVARTVKGKGVTAVEDKGGFHGKALDDPDAAVAELGGVRELRIEVARPNVGGEPHVFATGALELPQYELDSEVATRKAYGEALAAVGAARGDVVALDGEVSNSTFAEIFAAAHPERYFEMYISEQQMVAAAVGLQARRWVPFASTFACFLTRAYDFIRMGAVSRARICLCGSHAGVSIGEDGPSQMGLEDLAMMRAVSGSLVLYPCDGNQTAKLVERIAEWDGIAYIRTTRAGTPVIYGPDDDFEIGGSRIVRASDDDAVAIVAAGITLHEALKAADELEEEGVSARVIDLYSLKPIDAETLRTAAEATGGRILTVEDHWREGGLGEAVLGALADGDERPRVVQLAVEGMPGSGKPAELLAAAGIDAANIADAARNLVAAGALTSP
jgi:transketolase